MTEPIQTPDISLVRGTSGCCGAYPAGCTAGELPFISIVIVARNAGNVIERCLESFRAQDYPISRREFILVHSDEHDGTEEAMRRWGENQGRVESVWIGANPKRLLAPGWNIALAAVRGDVIIRMDAHAIALPGFLRNCAAIMIERGESIVGGRVPVCEPAGWESYLCWMTSRSPFGAGQAAYRRRRTAGYVDTLAYAAYHRRVFERVGGFDERLGRTEDNEMHHRMKMAGFRFYFDPRIESVQNARSTLLGMLRQKYLNGYWISLTLPISPNCFSLRHFVPGAFVAVLVFGIMLSLLGTHWPLSVVLAGYFFLSLAAAILELATARTLLALAAAPVLPLTFFALHTANGLGLWAGFLALPGKLAEWAGYVTPRPMRIREAA